MNLSNICGDNSNKGEDEDGELTMFTKRLDIEGLLGEK